MHVCVRLVTRERKRRERGAYVSEGEEGAVEEEHDAEQHEERAERRERHADFCRVGQYE